MRCLELLVPALFWPDAAAAPAVPTPEAPALDRLFARGRRVPATGPGTEAWIARRYALDAGREVPFAALALLGTGGSPGKRVWMCADPVHLHAQGTELFLTSGSDLSLRPEEAASMIEALDALFEADGLRFEAIAPASWLVALSAPPELLTVPLALVHGRSIGRLLPQGGEASAWQTRLSEAQMLLHAAPVNAAREAHGELPINSLWFWGAGALPERVDRPWDRVLATDAITRGFALLAGAEVAEPPTLGDELLHASGAATTLVRLDQAGDAAARGDRATWCTAIAELSTRWIAPALEALRHGRLGQLCVTGFAGRSGVTVTARRVDAWRVWRRSAPYGRCRPEPDPFTSSSSTRR